MRTDGNFSANHRSFQKVRVPTGCSTLGFLATGCLQADKANLTTDMPHVPGDLTSWVADNTISWLDSSWDGPVYTVATFARNCFILWWIFGARGTSKTEQRQTKLDASKNRDERVQLSCFLRSLMLQLAWFLDVAYPSLNSLLRSKNHKQGRFDCNLDVFTSWT